MTIGTDERLGELAEHWERQCNRYANERCTSYGCCVRGGYDGSFPFDFEKATCIEHETAVALRARTASSTREGL